MAKVNNVMDIVGNLPAEIVHKIFLYLNSRDMVSFRSCCSKWKKQTDCKYIWNIRYKKKFGKICVPEKSTFLQNLLDMKYCETKALYLYNQELQSNWIKQKCKKIILKERSIEYVKAVDESELVMLTDDRVKVIDSSTGEVKKDIYAPEQVSDIIDVSLNKDYVVIVQNRWGWIIDLTTADITKYTNLWSVNSLVTIEVYKHLLVINECLMNFAVFNLKTREFEYRCMDADKADIIDEKIIAKLHTNAIKILDLEYKTLMIIENLTSYYKFYLKKDHLIIVNDHVSIWNLETKTKIFRIPEVWPNVCFLDSNKLIYTVGGRTPNIFFVWNYITGKYILKVDTRRHIYSLHTNGRFVFTQPLTMTPATNLSVWCSQTGSKIKSKSLLTAFFFSEFQDKAYTKTKLVFSKTKNTPRYMLRKLNNYQYFLRFVTKKTQNWKSNILGLLNFPQYEQLPNYLCILDFSPD